jgi:outer membrane protein
MKHTSLVVSIISLAAVIILYVITFTGAGKKEHEQATQPTHNTTGGLRIAYVKVDSVILNYGLAHDLQDEFSKKQEAYTNEYSNKRSSYEQDAANFQEKLNNGGFLTQESAKQERDRLVGRQQEIQQLDQELSSKLSDTQSANTQQLLDSLINYLNVLNKKRHYDYVLNGTDVLVGEEASNITKEVLTNMNAIYNQTRKGK